MVGVSLVLKRVAVLGTVTAFAVLAAGCGDSGDDEPSATPSETTESASSVEDWVDGVCTAVATWRVDITTATATLEDPKNVSVNSFNEAATGVADATGALADEVAGLGPPDIEAGEELQEELTSLSDNVASEVDTLNGATGDETSTADDMIAQAATITGSISTISGEIEATLNNLAALDTGSELQDAIATTESCQELDSAD